MDFFNSLSLDLKLMVVGIAGFALLALFSGNPKTEKRYLVVLALLASVGLYRFVHTTGHEQDTRAATSVPPATTTPGKAPPLVSTSAK